MNSICRHSVHECRREFLRPEPRERESRFGAKYSGQNGGFREIGSLEELEIAGARSSAQPMHAGHIGMPDAHHARGAPHGASYELRTKRKAKKQARLTKSVQGFVCYIPAVRKTIRVVAALIERDGRYLITQRRSTAVLPLLWEFPGGKVEPAEEDNVALRREMRERLGASISVEKLISFVCHPYESYSVDLFLYQCTLLEDHLEARAVQDFRWVASSDFDAYPFTPADEASMTQLLGENAP